MLSPLKPVPGAAQPKPNVRKTLDTSLRFSQALAAARWATCGMNLVLPELFLARALRNVMGKKHFLRQFAWTLPYMTIFALIGACGELVEYLCGPGNALARIE